MVELTLKSGLSRRTTHNTVHNDLDVSKKAGRLKQKILNFVRQAQNVASGNASVVVQLSVRCFIT